ncbi:MAG: hypothetical protein ACRBN8_45590 [Nannocystales bacterium]
MPSQLHEVLVAMVRESETLPRSIAEWATGEPMPAHLQLRTRDQSYSDIQPPEYRADLVVEFVPKGSERPTRMMIFEVQLTRDSDKRRTWPAYQAVLRAQYRCPAMVVVLAPDPAVARWCAEPIDLDGRGTSIMRPTVIGPSRVPVVTDLTEAFRTPGLTALSVIAHGRTEHALEVGRAGLRAAEALDASDSELYTDMVFHHLDAAARKALEHEVALKLKNKYEYQSSTFRRLIAAGKALGQAEGKDGKLQALELLLESRGFHLDAAFRQRLADSDVDELDGLAVRAVLIATLDEFFDS